LENEQNLEDKLKIMERYILKDGRFIIELGAAQIRGVLGMEYLKELEDIKNAIGERPIKRWSHVWLPLRRDIFECVYMGPKFCPLPSKADHQDSNSRISAHSQRLYL